MYYYLIIFRSCTYGYTTFQIRMTFIVVTSLTMTALVLGILEDSQQLLPLALAVLLWYIEHKTLVNHCFIS